MRPEGGAPLKGNSRAPSEGGIERIMVYGIECIRLFL